MMGGSLAVEKIAYPIVDFLEWQRNGQLDLNPPYQRRQVWHPRLKSKLIDSLLRGYPIPLIFLHNRLNLETSRNVRQVVDGQQRLRTILSFINADCLGELDEWDTFTVLRSHNADYHGLTFDQFPADVRERLLQAPLSVNVLPGDVDDATVLQIFQRINSTGLKLNAQELRNATWFGEFKDLAYKLAYEQLQRWISWGLFDRQQLGQMLEVEFTSDLAGLLLEGVLPRTKGSLDRIYKTYDSDFDDQAALTARFQETFEVLDHVFRPGAAKAPLRRFRTTTWVYSCFALATAADRFDLAGNVRKKANGTAVPIEEPAHLIQILEKAEVTLRSDEIDPDVAKKLRGATSDRASREARIQFLRSLA